MPFSRSRRSGPLSRRTPAIDSQHLTKYAPLLEKANSVYNSEPTAFLKSATPTPPPITSMSDSTGLHLLPPCVNECLFFLSNCTYLKVTFSYSTSVFTDLTEYFTPHKLYLLYQFQEYRFLLAPQRQCKREGTFDL